MKEYTIIFERGEKSWGAYVPDLPVCAAVGNSKEEVEKLILRAIDMHLEDLRAKGEPIPDPTHFASSVRVAA